MSQNRITQLIQEFTYTRATGQGAEYMSAVTKVVVELAIVIDKLVPEGQAKKQALARLKECHLWATDAIAREVGRPKT